MPNVAVPPDNAVQPQSRAAWRQWLAKHHGLKDGVWLITFKVSSGQPRISYDASVEEALCYGWVDSKPRKLDDERSMLWFAPRKARSGWSAPNKERVARMIAAGLMAPAGLAKVEAAQSDGSWAALDAVEALAIPDDLRLALGALPRAAQHFDAFPRSTKRGILEWIQNAKRATTRAARVEETARLAARKERANQWPRPPAPSSP
jgi:uncharacterized protein YdeI (YjbR/CyaY-like superfamily)